MTMTIPLSQLTSKLDDPSFVVIADLFPLAIVVHGTIRVELHVSSSIRNGRLRQVRLFAERIDTHLQSGDLVRIAVLGVGSDVVKLASKDALLITSEHLRRAGQGHTAAAIGSPLVRLSAARARGRGMPCEPSDSSSSSRRVANGQARDKASCCEQSSQSSRRLTMSVSWEMEASKDMFASLEKGASVVEL